MYGIRNSFIHGSKIPNVTQQQRVIYIDTVANMLKSIVIDGKMPNMDKISEKLLDKYG